MVRTLLPLAACLLLAGCAAPRAEPPSVGAPNPPSPVSAWIGHEAAVGVLHLALEQGAGAGLASSAGLLPVASYDPGQRQAVLRAAPGAPEALVIVEAPAADDGKALQAASLERGSVAFTFGEEQLLVAAKPGSARVDVWPSPAAKRVTLPNGTTLDTRGLSLDVAPGESVLVAYPDLPDPLALRLAYVGLWPRANVTWAG